MRGNLKKSGQGRPFGWHLHTDMKERRERSKQAKGMVSRGLFQAQGTTNAKALG